MSENQPREYDVVLGGGNQAPVDGVVLGGIEGVKRRWESANIQQKIVALSEALNYGDVGSDFVIQVWQSDLEKVSFAAYLLLSKREDAKVKRALQEYKMGCVHTLQGVDTRCIAVHPNGKVFFDGSNSINIFDLHTGEVEATSMNYEHLRTIAVNPNGTIIIARGGTSYSESIIKIWDLQTKEHLFFLHEHSGGFRLCSYSRIKISNPTPHNNSHRTIFQNFLFLNIKTLLCNSIHQSFMSILLSNRIHKLLLINLRTPKISYYFIIFT